MPPKPPIRLAAKPPAASKSFAKPAIPIRLANPAARAPLQSKPTPASPSSNAPPPPQPPQWHKTGRASTGGRYLKWGTNGVVALCAMLFIRDHFIELQHVRGSSMAPTLSPDAHETGREDYVIVRPYGNGPKKKGTGNANGDDNLGGVKRGDVVTFWKPHKPGEMGIKRVVAIAGDTVYPTRGYALDPAFYKSRLKGCPDGLPDHDEDSVVAGREGEEVGRVVVPYGHVWIEGDNWRKSLDSNDFGPISKSLIQGKAVKVWRDWWGLRDMGDERTKGERGMRSRVVEGRSEVPAVYLDG